MNHFATSKPSADFHDLLATYVEQVRLAYQLPKQSALLPSLQARNKSGKQLNTKRKIN
ncbi:hypothetical protein GGR92_002821 [Spirosoma lacussanchae]|uniref:hypothetical protein n=1 Tax=Spirosoma lacussanchae TaxID=1884249 RepID=UPI001485DDDB|nr:hypothetical protein [Spirosoma lacussanchae]